MFTSVAQSCSLYSFHKNFQKTLSVMALSLGPPYLFDCACEFLLQNIVIAKTMPIAAERENKTKQTPNPKLIKCAIKTLINAIMAVAFMRFE